MNFCKIHMFIGQSVVRIMRAGATLRYRKIEVSRIERSGLLYQILNEIRNC